MMGVSTREVKRIEAEHQYAKAIAANAGKELDFFQDPDLETKKRANVRQKHKGFKENRHDIESFERTNSIEEK